ncbi:MAG: flippase-like domain-containing protein [Saprospiraceae bacterium]|nr:flippase-like domain-containing protein [Saprospiraceae bacterium]
MSTLVNVPSLSRILTIAIKVVVLLVFLYLLYFSFARQKELTALFTEFTKQLNTDRLIYLLFALLLVYANWWLEALKWQKLLVPILPIPFLKAFKSVLIGVTSSIFTPNRVGEYLGRVITIETKYQLAAMTALGFSSLIQLIFLCVLGIGGANYLIWHSYPIPFGNTLTWILVILLPITSILLLKYAKNLYRYLKSKLGHLWPKLWSQLDYILRLPFGYFGQVIILTGIRISVYVLQYWLLLQFFQIDVPEDLAVATILLGYFIQSGLPLPSFFALIARGEITLFLWNFFAVNELSILAASYGLWVINVVLPALVGMIYVMKIKVKSS